MPRKKDLKKLKGKKRKKKHLKQKKNVEKKKNELYPEDKNVFYKLLDDPEQLLLKMYGGNDAQAGLLFEKTYKIICNHFGINFELHKTIVDDQVIINYSELHRKIIEKRAELIKSIVPYDTQLRLHLEYLRNKYGPGALYLLYKNEKTFLNANPMIIKKTFFFNCMVKMSFFDFKESDIMISSKIIWLSKKFTNKIAWTHENDHNYEKKNCLHVIREKVFCDYLKSNIVAEFVCAKIDFDKIKYTIKDETDVVLTLN